jgi:adenine-specific DNA-methyltransferase
LLKPGGRAAFVVPAEIGHAPYAAPVLEYFVRNFGLVHVVAIRDKLFPDLSEDCWLLYAQDFGRQTDQIRFTSLESFHPTTEPPPFPLRVSLLEWRQVWKRRLRPLLMPESARHLYEHVSARPDTRRFGDLAKIGIGYVTGANDFFHVRPSEAAEFDLPSEFLHPTVRNGRKLVASVLTKETVKNWLHADEPVLLLNIPKDELTLPESVLRYLNTANADRVRQAYKCRQRDPWYTVPDVKKPHFFLSYLSGRSVALVRNQAGCTCTNALHYVRFNDLQAEFSVVEAWASAFVRLSCEIEGHPLGGGLLKLEPREAAAIVLPAASVRGEISDEIAAAGVLALQSWRHYQPLPRVHD